MTTRPSSEPAPVDAVIAWVDGGDPAHRKLRASYQAEAEADSPLSENATNPHRWADDGELLYCLRSIHNHAPWIRKIWLVTADQTADVSALPAALQAKISYVSHGQIFAGFEHCLPTFNSLAIESLLWRIEGLAERFIYFNDDAFLTAPLAPDAIFDAEGRSVLRGGWRDFSAMTLTSAHYDDPVFFNHYMQINAAQILGYRAERLFSTAHVAHPMRRSILASLFERHRDAFAHNISFRFRDIRQFWPQSLYNHACIANDQAAYVPSKDHFHVFSGYGNDMPEADLRKALDDGLQGAKFLCINDLPQLEAKIPDIRDWLDRAIAIKNAPAQMQRGVE